MPALEDMNLIFQIIALLKNIIDGNGFDVTGGWTKSTLTVDGFSYFVYIANAPTTDTNAPFTFKY